MASGIYTPESNDRERIDRLRTLLWSIAFIVCSAKTSRYHIPPHVVETFMLNLAHGKSGPLTGVSLASAPPLPHHFNTSLPRNNAPSTTIEYDTTMAATTWDGAFKDMDPLTWQTIVQMQLEDCEQLAAASKGKGKQREGTQSDAQLAMQLYADDLKHSDHYLQDRNMAQSAAMAVLQDGNLIAEAFKEEQQAASDREMAMNLDARGPRQQRNAPAAAGRAAAPASNETQGANKKLKTDVKDPWQDDEMLEKVTAMYMKAPDEPMPDTSEEPDIEGGESSAWAAARETTANRKRPMRTCIACSDEKSFFEVIRVPCGHEYCRDCLDSLFTASMKDETLFPPRCDNQEISLDWVRLWLSSDVAKQFSEKYEELNTKNRTYCHDKKCSEFISENAYNGSIATCPKCTKTTCNSCKNPSHTGDCPDDEAMRQLMATADTQQWQRCYKCTAMVELDQGCYHMR